MRPLLALVISISILLGVRGYLSLAATLRALPPGHAPEAAAAGTFAAEITLTFDAEADAFSLEPVALLLRQQDRVLLRREGRVPAGEPIIVEPIESVTEGANEFYFESVPRDDQAAVARAVRVRILRDGVPLAEKTLWAPPGQIPRGQIVVDIPRSSRSESLHDHAP